MQFFLFLAFSTCLAQYMMPIMYDPTMVNEINYMQQEIMEKANAIQRQIQAQNQAKMATIPADGKVRSYEKVLPGGKISETSYHNKGSNHEEFSESYFSQTSRNPSELYLSASIPATKVIETSYASSIDPASSSSNEYNDRFFSSPRGYVYDNRPNFHRYSSAYPEYTKVIPIATIVPAQIDNIQYIPVYGLPFPSLKRRTLATHKGVHLMQHK